MPAAPDDEPLVCDVSLTRTIPAITELDRFTFAGVAGEVVHVTLENQGGSYGFDPHWRLLMADGPPDAACGTWSGPARDCTLPAGDSHAVEVIDGGANATGTYSISVAGAGCTTNRPNLQVSALTGKAVTGAGAPYTAKDTTRNTGTAPSPASATRFFLSANAVWDAGDTLLSPPTGRAVPALEVGAANTGTTLLTIPAGALTGKYFLIAYADAGAAITESNEADNTKAKPLYVGPDLAVPALTAPPSVAPGGAIAVVDTTRNRGGAPTTTATTTRFYLSGNKRVDASDVLLGPGRPVPVLAAGASSTQTTIVTIPAGTTPGTYYVLARADDGGVQVESRETNNVKAIAVAVGP
jgi:subtilase family serine protease